MEPREFAFMLVKLDPEDAQYVLDTAQAMVDSDQHRWIAYELIDGHAKAFHALNRQILETLGRGMDCWSVVDSFSRTLSGPAWRDGLLSTQTIHDWAHSPDRWWRRAALVSSVALNMRSKGGEGDVPRTLGVCEMLVDDHDDMIVKAMSWALRELVVHDRQAVQGFLNRFDGVLAERI
ncbi:MAG: DNA alkylation repair protein [Anaerolineales bacterium]